MARITQADLDSLRMPADALGNPGLQDIEALKAAAWGSDYDVDARRRAIEEARNRITAALVAQQVPVQLAQQIAEAQTSGGGQRGGDVSQGLSGQTSSGATSFGSSGNTGPGGAQGFGGWGGSAAPGSDFMGGAPPGGSILGGDRSSLADPNEGGAMTTANASMTAPDPGAQPASMFGRSGDDSSQASKDAREAQAFDFAMSAAGKTSLTDRSVTAPGWGRGDEPDTAVDPDTAAAVAANAPTAPSLPSSGRGKGDFGDFSEDSDVLAEGATSTMGGKGSTLAMGIPGWGNAVPGSFVNALGQVVDMGKTALGRGWGAVVPDAPIAPADRAPVVATPGRQPTGSPVTFAGNPPGAPPGAPGDTGAVAPGGGFGPGADQAVGGYTSGFASTEGFGGGYSGSASMGNTQGAQGFTAGAPGGGFAVGAGSFSAGFQAGFDTAAAAFGGGSDPGGGAGAGAGQGSGESGAGTGGAGDTAGGSAGSGVG